VQPNGSHEMNPRLPNIFFDICVINSYLTQGKIQAGDRVFWYKVDSGFQYLAELDTNNDDEFAELDATCLCEVFGKKCSLGYSINDLCSPIWTEDLNEHLMFAGLCLGVLLSRRGRMVSTGTENAQATAPGLEFDSRRLHKSRRHAVR
jgi:hypothetical protein